MPRRTLLTFIGSVPIPATCFWDIFVGARTVRPTPESLVPAHRFLKRQMPLLTFDVFTIQGLDNFSYHCILCSRITTKGWIWKEKQNAQFNHNLSLTEEMSSGEQGSTQKGLWGSSSGDRQGDFSHRRDLQDHWESGSALQMQGMWRNRTTHRSRCCWQPRGIPLQKMPRHRLRPVHVLNQYSEKYRSLLWKKKSMSSLLRMIPSS